MRYFILLLVLLYSDISLSKNCNHAKSRKESILLAKNQFAYEFNRVYYLKNYDGDTVTVEIEGVHPLIGHEIKIRVKGIDTPEIRARKSCEREIAKSAKEFTTKFLTSGGKITLQNCSRGTFFRLVCEVRVGRDSLGEALIDRGLAVDYANRKGHVWCN